MTEAGWTRELPAKRGFYWYRPVHYKAAPRILEIGPGMSLPLIVLNTDRFYLSQWDGEWLGPLTPDSYRQGRVAALDEVERYMAMRLRLAEASLATEVLAGNEVKQWRERAAIAELHGMQRHVSDIKEYIAQQAQDEKEVGDAGDV